MKAKHKHLTAADRGVIQGLLYNHCSIRSIARKLGVFPSTVSREIKRGEDPDGNYQAWLGQLRYEQARKRSRKKKKLTTSTLQKYVVSKLQIGWSPEQISGRMKYEQLEFYVCPETIYQWLYSDPWAYDQEKLYQYLRWGRKKRRSKIKGRRVHKSKIPNRVSIDQRPKVVNQRQEYGHWESDSVIYPYKYAINSLNELLTGYVRFTKLKRKKALLTTQAVINQLSGEVVKTLTVDNGSEWVKHQTISKELGIKTYFADPYASYQRGANENVNMLLRGYLPKRYNITNLTQAELDNIAWELNHRPRKRLGYRTPAEVRQEYLLQLKSSKQKGGRSKS